jgi:hypothetical protein
MYVLSLHLINEVQSHGWVDPSTGLDGKEQKTLLPLPGVED